MNKYYAHAMGGLGDYFVQYFGRHPFQSDLAYLKAIKLCDPECYIKLISHTSLPNQILDFFEFNPWIDEIQILPWRNPNVRKRGPCPHEQQEAGKQYFKLSTQAKAIGLKRIKQLEIFTCSKDDRQLEAIVKQGPFILLHPFSTDPNRIALTSLQYRKLIQKAIDKFNCNIIIVGKSHIKNHNNKKLVRQEEVVFNHPKVINLINKTNIRVSAKLAFLAEVTIANVSMYNGVLCGGTKPLLLLNRIKFNYEKMNEFFHTTDHITYIKTSRQNDRAIDHLLDKIQEKGYIKESK